MCQLSGVLSYDAVWVIGRSEHAFLCQTTKPHTHFTMSMHHVLHPGCIHVQQANPRWWTDEKYYPKYALFWGHVFTESSEAVANIHSVIDSLLSCGNTSENLD